MTLFTSTSTGWTPGGHGLLRALPRSYQVTPDIPGPATSDTTKGSQATPADSLKESQLAAGPGPSPRHRTSPTPRITTASLETVAGKDPPSRHPGRLSGSHTAALESPLGASEVRALQDVAIPARPVAAAVDHTGHRLDTEA